MSERLSGGCQCGAVRYSVQGEIAERAICHCRMCQKAVGSIVWPFLTVKVKDVTWTRGTPALYRSSAAGERGFCGTCGTPLSFQTVGGTEIDLSIGSLDDPSAIKPDHQYFTGTRMPWFDELAGLPEKPSSASPEDIERRRPYQHPDHDTTEWPRP
ncbi:GFA family protein [Aliirhizobium terrae]|uniref:GFA family protein n=1 Tax=Terrirhizobium terrae TaxID=2926709 RepID=UPI00257806DF|nr:GFA family protein [Rhizobium sp. CC-CFT758]WJH39525.1 GFA family protein [Rhizobium sp. CC-CFT758]